MWQGPLIERKWECGLVIYQSVLTNGQHIVFGQTLVAINCQPRWASIRILVTTRKRLNAHDLKGRFLKNKIEVPFYLLRGYWTITVSRCGGKMNRTSLLHAGRMFRQHPHDGFFPHEDHALYGLLFGRRDSRPPRDTFWVTLTDLNLVDQVLYTLY